MTESTEHLEVPEADAAEQAAAGSPEPRTPEPGPLGVEVPEADAMEQADVVAPGERVTDRDLAWDADPADAADQSREIPLEEDEYR